MRKAVERFETLGQNEFVAATYNRIALTLIEQGRHRDALSDLAEAEALAAGNEHEAAILSSTLAFKGRCLDAERDTEGAREAMSRALQYAMGCGNEGVAQECEAFLGKTEGAPRWTRTPSCDFREERRHRGWGRRRRAERAS